MNNTSQHTLIAVFRDRAAAQAAVDDLQANGFTSSDIYGADNAGTATSTSGTTAHHHEGGIVGWFKSIFGDEDYTEHTAYESAVQSGNVAVRVDADPDASDRACQILNQHSPLNVQERDAAGVGTAAAERLSGRDEYVDTKRRSAAGVPAETAAVRGDTPESIPVIREELQVGKRVVERGGVRIYSRTIEEPVSEDVRLREEKVRVDRSPANRDATAAELQPGKERVYEVQEFREEPVVSKQARVVEEVRIGKDATERVETVRDTVRRTEVNVENLGSSAEKTRTNVRTGADRYEAGFEGTQPATAGYANDAAYESDPAYQYGVNASSDPRYSGRSYDEIENDLRTDYARRYPGSTWENAKASVRRGWDKLAAKAHNA